MTSVVKQVMGLEAKPVEELQGLWRDLFHTEPPPYPKAYLVPRLAYRLQELALGGLSEKAQKKLDALADQLEAGKTGKSAPQAGDRLLAGTRLIREWRGERHTVTAVDGGFEHQGQRYKSLSAIARKITGTQWNGPLFFGMRMSHQKKGSA